MSLFRSAVRHAADGGGARLRHSSASNRIPAPSRPARIARRRLRGLQALTLLAGLVAATLGGMWIEDQVEDDARADFAIRSGAAAEQFEARLRAYIDVTYSIRAFMEHQGATHVTREEFHRYASSLAVTERYPGLLNLSFTRHIRQAERDAFERRMRAEYDGLLPPGAAFAIKPPGERPSYDVVAYIEPVAGNEPAVGLDLATEPARSDAVRRARDSGLVATTRGMRLLREGEENAISVLLRLAVYDGAGTPGTIEARRQAYAGVAGVAIRLPDLVEAARSGQDKTQSRFVLEDVTEPAVASVGGPHGAVLYDSLTKNREASVPIAYVQYGVLRRIRVGDRTWEAHIAPLSDPVANDVRLLPYAAAAAVLIITLLLAGLQQLLATANARGAELRRNLRTLESHRQRLSETQEIANIGAWEWDVRQDHQVWSERLYRLLGREVGDPPTPTHEFFATQIVHPDDIAMVRRALKGVLADGKPVELECRVRTPEGAERIVSSVTRLDLTDDGARARLVGTVRDITEQHRAAAREREQLLFIQTMMDAIPTPVFQKDPEGRFRACNDAWCQFIGKPREAIIGHTIEEMSSGEHVEAIREQDRALLAQPAASTIEITMTDAGGRARQLMVHKASHLAADGSIAGLVGVMFDITDRKQAEERLRDMVEQLDHRNAVSLLLGEFSEVLQSCMTLEEAYEIVSKYLTRLAPGTGGVLYLVDAAHGRGEKVISWGAATASSAALAADACVAMRRKRARSVADSTTELNCRHFDAEPPPSYACLPLTAHGEPVGMLHVEHLNAESKEKFAGDIGWMALNTAAEHIGLAVANLALRETLREQAMHDKLTGLYNRNYMNARFEQELARSKRTQRPLAVVMLDIDHFKHFNDTFGHAAGDHVLRELGRVIRGSARKSDVACRYGGEEFVLFLPEAGGEVALKRAQEIREAMKALQLDWEGQPLGTVTLSAGVAAYPAHGEDAESLLRCADRALYQAKQLGRDRVVAASSPAPLARIA